jgi:hypothetical protein
MQGGLTGRRGGRNSKMLRLRRILQRRQEERLKKRKPRRESLKPRKPRRMLKTNRGERLRLRKRRWKTRGR